MNDAILILYAQKQEIQLSIFQQDFTNQKSFPISEFSAKELLRCIKLYAKLYSLPKKALLISTAYGMPLHLLSLPIKAPQKKTIREELNDRLKNDKRYCFSPSKPIRIDGNQQYAIFSFPVDFLMEISSSLHLYNCQLQKIVNPGTIVSQILSSYTNVLIVYLLPSCPMILTVEEQLTAIWEIQDKQHPEKEIEQQYQNADKKIHKIIFACENKDTTIFTSKGIETETIGCSESNFLHTAVSYCGKEVIKP